MNIIRTENLKTAQKDNLLTLQEICQNHDHISLTFPMDESCIYYLLYDNHVLLSALCGFFNEDGDWECSAFTRPEKRKRGYFTQLLEEFLKENDDCDVIFPIEESCKDTRSTLEAMDASFWYQEHMMELTAPDFKETDFFKKGVQRKDVAVSSVSVPETGPTKYLFQMNNIPVGHCYLDEREQAIYFYGFEIIEECRKQGLGSACLFLILDKLFSLTAPGQIRKVFLQVSGQNLPAMNLYKKAGFHITESISYYIY